jgi:hypothetical protein
MLKTVQRKVGKQILMETSQKIKENVDSPGK